MSVCAINDVKLMFVCFLAIVLFSEILPPVNVHTIMIFALHALRLNQKISAL